MYGRQVVRIFHDLPQWSCRWRKVEFNHCTTITRAHEHALPRVVRVTNDVQSMLGEFVWLIIEVLT